VQLSPDFDFAKRLVFAQLSESGMFAKLHCSEFQRAERGLDEVEPA
jgi:hypothetical protein